MSDAAFRDFHNRLRIMLSIDLDELQNVGLMYNASPENPRGAWAKWRHFRSNPSRYLIECPDDEAQKIWTIIERRAAPKADGE